MAEVGGQEWQASRGVLIATIPVHQRVRGESVSQVVQAGAVAIRGAAQPDLAGQPVKGAVDLPTVQAVAPTGDEQVEGHGSPGPMTLASGDVIGEHLAG